MVVRFFFYDFIDYKLSSASIPDYTIIKKINCETEQEDWYDRIYCKAVKICKGYLVPIYRNEFYSKKVLVVLRGGEAYNINGQQFDLFYYQMAFDVRYYLVPVGEKFIIRSTDGFYKMLIKAKKHSKKGIEFKFLGRG
jgi:hypothetical protein